MKDLLQSKKDYRDYARERRRNLSQFDISQRSSEICGQLANLECYKKAKIIAGFYPFEKEIDLRQLYHDSSKKFLLPRVIDDENITFYPFDSTTTLEKNKWGILEPLLLEDTATISPDLIIIPALMVDKNGFRLGYGKGYYDRYLSKLNGQCMKVVPVLDELIIDFLPHDEFDVPVDIAVSEKQVYYFRK